MWKTPRKDEAGHAEPVPAGSAPEIPVAPTAPAMASAWASQPPRPAEPLEATGAGIYWVQLEGQPAAEVQAGDADLAKEKYKALMGILSTSAAFEVRKVR